MGAAIRRMIVDMMDANHISERLASMRHEMNDLKVINARYWVKSPHTALTNQLTLYGRDDFWGSSKSWRI
jgi:hypothetical protein